MKNSINESLDLIRRALEDDSYTSKDILILNQKVNQDGTIKIISKSQYANEEVNKIIDHKLNYLVEKKIEKILEEKIPIILKKYFDAK